jgi:putative ABC transport system permease protein
MTSFAQNIRYAVRSFAKSPGFASVAVLTLALGIGANTAIFSVLDAVLLKPLPFPEAGRLFALFPRRGGEPGEGGAISPPEYADIAARQKTFDGVAALRDRAVNLTGAGEAERLQAFLVTPNLPQVLRVQPALGRGFLPEEGRKGAPRVAMLGHDLWRNRFGADPSIVGKAIQLDGAPATVVGVLAPGIRFPAAGTFFYKRSAQLWIASAWNEAQASRGDEFLALVGRLAAGSTPAAGQADLDRITAAFRAEYPQRYNLSPRWTLAAVPLADQYVGKTRASLYAVAGAVGLLLLVACADVANLLLARAASRRREFAVRIAVGANARRLVSQLLTESLLLAFAGGALGTLLSVWGVDLLVRMGPADLPRLADASVGGRVLLFTVALCAAAGALFGLAPVRQALHANVVSDLKGAGLDGVSGRRATLGSLIVVGQVAVALVVVAAAALLLTSFKRLSRVDPGFRSPGVWTLQTALARSKYADAGQATALYRRLLERLAATPGITAAGAIDPIPFSGEGWSGTYAIDGRPLEPTDPGPHAAYARVTPDYFRAMSVPLQSGRFFSESDAGRAPRVVIVDERLARRDWPGEDAVGKRILIGGTGGDSAEVIGVVGHVRYAALEEEGEPQLYLPVFQDPGYRLGIVVSTRGDSPAMGGTLREIVRALDPDIPTGSLRPMDALISAATSRQRFQVSLIALFAGAALLLAAIGLSGVLAQMVAARTREIGIRRALGASGQDVLALVLGRGLSLVGFGIAIGLAAAWATTRILRSLLFDVSPTDPAAFGAVTLILLAAAVLAALVPAWRALRVHPFVALRQE